MNQITKIGRLFYGIGIFALGIHQLIIKEFRPEILPPFPAWAHKYVVFPILSGVVLIFTGIIISGLVKIKNVRPKKICLYLGSFFLVLIVTCHLPYIFFFNPDKLSKLEVWFGVGEALAYCGGAFVMAGSFTENNFSENNKRSFELFTERLIPPGRIFFALLIILFGSTHFVFTDFVSTLVPSWLGASIFWTYFFGVALILSAIFIIFKIWIRPAAFLLAIMLFLFFLFFHIPDAIANPYAGGGNEIFRALVAVLFCGIALVIASSNIKNPNPA